VTFVSETQSSHHSRNTGGAVAQLVLLAPHRRPAVLALRSPRRLQLVHVVTRGEGRTQAEVDDDLAPVVVDHHGADATGAAHPRLHDADGPRGGDRSVHSVAA
jgi:hypothetical protein